MESEDKQIEELKQLVRRNIALTESVAHDLRSMRRASRFHSIIKFLWWAAILAASAYFYYVYVFPYINNILGLYQRAQEAMQAVSNFGR